MDTNEKLVLQRLLEEGVTTELKHFSMQHNLDDLIIHKRRVKKVEVMVPVKLKTMTSKTKWVRKLREQGYIDVDYSNNWNPRMAITEKGMSLLKQ